MYRLKPVCRRSIKILNCKWFIYKLRKKRKLEIHHLWRISDVIFETDSFQYWRKRIGWRTTCACENKDFLRLYLNDITIARNVTTENKPRWSVVSWKIIGRRQPVVMSLDFLKSREPVSSELGKNVDEERRSSERNDWDARRRKTRQMLRRPVGIGMRLKTLARNRPPGISNDSHSQTMISYYTYLSVVFFMFSLIAQN